MTRTKRKKNKLEVCRMVDFQEIFLGIISCVVGEVIGSHRGKR